MKYYRNHVLIFGGAGSLGTTLAKRMQETGYGVIVFSRDEAKHHRMAQELDDIEYVIGDVRDYDSVERAIQRYTPNVIINAAAMKQVPACENYPYEALRTNTVGTYNIVKAVEREEFQASIILSISTDKACKPVNSYGMTKALQERIHLNGRSPGIFNCVRYGNVLESTGSVIPVFRKMIKDGESLRVTHQDMTRFLLSLDQAVDLIETALEDTEGGKIFIPKVPSAKIIHLAELMDPSESPLITGIRPGEKLDEILISEEELMRTEDLGDVYVIHDIKSDKRFNDVKKEYSSKSDLMTKKDLDIFLMAHGVYNDEI